MILHPWPWYGISTKQPVFLGFILSVTQIFLPTLPSMALEEGSGQAAVRV